MLSLEAQCICIPGHFLTFMYLCMRLKLVWLILLRCLMALLFLARPSHFFQYFACQDSVMCRVLTPKSRYHFSSSHGFAHVDRGYVYHCLMLCLLLDNMSHVMRKPAFAICEPQSRRSACASAQSDQRLCCSLLGQYNISTCYSQNFKTLASLISWSGRFESYLVANPKTGFLVTMICSKLPQALSIGYMLYQFCRIKSLFLLIGNKINK